MASALILSGNLSPCVAQFPTSVGGRMLPLAGIGTLRLPTDPSGSTTITFIGVNANSEIRVYLPSGTEAAGVENCVADPVLSWSVYAPGNPNNTVTIRIVHPSYKIKEFNYTASAGVVNLPVQQERDPWYSNP